MENRTSFGLTAADYRRFRPRYPRELYDFLASSCELRDVALDCATGNGQAAIDLAQHFEHVVATDVSERQINEATAHPRVEYIVAAAEQLPALPYKFDLLAIAQGAHWIDLPAFYRSVRPMTRSTTLIAIWGYGHCSLGPALDPLLEQHIILPVEPYWGDGALVINEAYRTIDFPFVELKGPRFEIREQWDRESLFGYIKTWSAYKRCVAAGSVDPLTAFASSIDASGLWPDPQARRQVTFDVSLRLGRFA